MNGSIHKPTPDEIELVLKALSDDRFKWRTVSRVAHETKLDIATINAVLSKKRDEIVRSSSLSSEGDELYATRKHFNSKATPMEKLLGALKNRAD